MERESFEDEAVAELMNERFVCIKVDREERPDVDRIYMEACQAINGSGGWPLNAFLLPDGRPFYAGTYYPPERRYNRPAWTELLVHLSDLYRNDRDAVEEQANSLLNNIAGGAERLLRVEPQADGHEAWREAIVSKLRASYDQRHGGFGGAPKFPSSQSLEALLLNGAARGEAGDVHLAAHGMLAMLDGGIYDHLGGGFSRYTVDAAWRVPHFEKMLYDNALLLRLLGKLQAAAPRERFTTAIKETTAWLEREMRLPGGGYRAALDADSEGVEGKYYVWSLAEVEAILPPRQAAIMREFYNLTETGNWEEEHTNIPYRSRTLAEVAAALELPDNEAAELLETARTTLHEHRYRTRIHPGADDKLILQWNALLVSGWCWCYRGTGEERYRQLATDLWKALTVQLLVEGRWYRNLTSGKLGAPAFLDDYAALATAALDLYEVTFDWSLIDNDLGFLSEGANAGAGRKTQQQGTANRGLATARGIVNFLLTGGFAQPGGPLFLLRPPEGSELPVVPVELFDNALPSGNAQLADCLLRLYRLTGREDYRERGETMLAALAGSMERYPTSFGTWVHTALQHALPEREVVVTGEGAGSAAAAFLSVYRPGLLIVATETAREDVPLFTNRYLDGSLRFYVCENQRCRLPVTTAAEAAELLNVNV